MGAPIVTISATIMCAHAGQAKIIPTQMRVTAGGVPVSVQTNQFIVAGCAFTVPPGVPMPCVPGMWTPGTGSLRVTAGGVPVMLQTSMAMNTGMGPPLPFIIASPGQMKATAT